ncbi:MAG TPA: hypothetical protein VG013_39580 [Gemmataceae bacterium]|nr:hypothetical protein [Gemmataceae bacterium]
MNLVFELGEGSRVLRMSVGPRLLLDRETLSDLSESSAGFRDGRTGLGVASETHAKSFLVRQRSFARIGFQDCEGAPSREWTLA